MTYIAAEARQDLLDTIATAVDHLGVALAALGAAYEQLDDHTADRLESELFGPTQMAYGRAQRTYSGFAARHDLRGRAFVAPESAGAPSLGVKGFLERAVDTVALADATLSALQDSMMPVEVGDPQLRAGLTEVRTLVADLRSRARELVRTLGR